MMKKRNFDRGLLWIYIILIGAFLCLAAFAGGNKKKVHDATTLLASTTQTGSTTSYGDAIYMAEKTWAVIFTLDVTDATSVAADKLNVYVQTKLDNTNWIDVYHFTQIDGNLTTKRYTGKIHIVDSLTEFEHAAALGEHTSRGLIGDCWRVKTVTTENTDARFTYSVTAMPLFF